MSNFLWRTAGAALLLALLGGNTSAWGTPTANTEWADANAMTLGDPYCGYGLTWPYLPYIPANLPPALHKKAEDIARESEGKITALKKEIMARNLELYTLIRRAETPRSDISELSGKLASLYTDLRHAYHDFMSKIKREVGVIPLFRHVGQAPAAPQAITETTQKITLVPYTPLVWDITFTPEPALSPAPDPKKPPQKP